MRKRIDAALNAAAETAGLTRAALDELTVPDHGLALGERRVPVGPGAAVVTADQGRLSLAWEDAKGAVRVSPPKALKDADPNGVKDARALVREIEKDLSAQKVRLETLYLKIIDWDHDTWRARYADHGTLALLARRLLWRATWADRATVVLPVAEGCQDVTGAAVDCSGARLTLWHPLDSDAAEIAAWRARLMDLRIVQPHKQAWRETYRLTDAERATRTYSNRFAGHILRQHQMMTLAHLNGWTCIHRMAVEAPNDEQSYIRLPDYDLQAEFWTDGSGGINGPRLDSCAYIYLDSDRVVFYRLAEAGRPYGEGAEVPLDEVPPRVFSEIMRHCDLFTSVASISLDPEWMDRGADGAHPGEWGSVADAYWTDCLTAALSVTAATRRGVLAAILPKLPKAAALSLETNHLRVDGKRRTYLIHLGSAAVLLADSRRHLSIVRAPAKTGRIYLPFEGDPILSLILSKALMLVDDDKITDRTILAQIGR